MKKILTTMLIIALIFSLCACVITNTDSQSGSSGTQEQTNPSSNDKQENISKTLTFGSTFEFDDLEIVIGSQVNWVKVDNQFSEQDGADVIELPISVKNLSDETHSLNMFYYKFYGPDGNQLDDVSAYFDNDNLSAGDMRTGATQNTNLHLLYTGDGDYYIEFSEFIGDKIEIKLPINK